MNPPNEPTFPFQLGATFGTDAEPLVDHIILAEFDIDTGSTVRHQFPRPVEGYANDYFAEYMLPEGAHNREQDSTMLFLNRDKPRLDEGTWSGDPDELTDASGPEQRFLYGINIVRTKHDKNVRRGAVVKAMAVFSRYHFVDVFKAPLIMALDRYYDEPGVAVLEQLFNALNSMPLSALPRPTWYERAIMSRGVAVATMGSLADAHFPNRWQWTTSVQFGDAKMRLTIPLHRSPDDIAEASIATLVRIFGEGTMKIYNAAVAGQRILFVGYNHAAGQVCNFVLATVAMVSPPIVGMLKRCFPYGTLSDLGFLEVPGYIAGVTNPMFEQHEEWWDLLCVLDLGNNTGSIVSSEEKKAEKDRAAGRQVERKVEERLHDPMDEKFMAKVTSGVDAKLGDDWVRRMFFLYTQALVDGAMDLSRFGASARLTEPNKKFFTINEKRLLQLSRVPEFSTLSLNPWHGIPAREGRTVVDGGVLRSHLRRLVLEETDNHQDIQTIFNDFATTLDSERHLQVLIALLPELGEGIAVVAAGLFHPSPAVRRNTVVLFRKFESYASTQPVVDTLNNFIALAYKRVAQEVEEPQTRPQAKPLPHTPMEPPPGMRPKLMISQSESTLTRGRDYKVTHTRDRSESAASGASGNSDDGSTPSVSVSAVASPSVAARKKIASMRGSASGTGAAAKLWAPPPPLPPPPK